MSETDWKSKFNDMLNICQQELKKTTQIGAKMLSAGQSNSKLCAEYESLGRLVAKSLANSDLKWENEKAQEYLDEIARLEKEISSLEDDVQKIKKDS